MHDKQRHLAHVAARFSCTVEQVQRQFRRNAKQLHEMADHAEKLGRKYRGKTAAEHRADAERFDELGK